MIAFLRSLFEDFRIREDSLVHRWLQNYRIRNAVIDPNSKCPACGARNGKLKTVMVETQAKPNKTVMVEHTCAICEAAWYEPTIVKPEKWVSSKLLAANNQTPVQ